MKKPPVKGGISKQMKNLTVMKTLHKNYNTKYGVSQALPTEKTVKARKKTEVLPKNSYYTNEKGNNTHLRLYRMQLKILVEGNRKILKEYL